MAWFRRKVEKSLPPPVNEERTVRTEGLFTKCDGCSHSLFIREFEDNQNVCPKCGFHARIGARERLRLTFDDEKWIELDSNLASNDPLKFVDKKPYAERLEAMQKSTGLADALITGEGTVGGYPTIICSMELDFVGGSLGSVVGEKIVRAIERVIENRAALIIYSSSGGARMLDDLNQFQNISMGGPVTWQRRR